MSSEDVSTNSAGYITSDYIDSLFAMLYEAKRMKDGYTEDQRKLINDRWGMGGQDRGAMVHAMSQLSDDYLASWEENLLMLQKLSDNNTDDLYDYQQVRIITMFLMILGSLKPRSRRHLENFLSAVTDGDWVDGFILGKGSESEFRCIDRATEGTRKEFGL